MPPHVFARLSYVGLIALACSSKSSQVTKLVEPDGGATGGMSSQDGGAGGGGGAAGKSGGGSTGKGGTASAGAASGGAGDAGEPATGGGAGQAGAAGGGCTDPDEFTASACGDAPGTSRDAYAGRITVTVSGTLIGGPGAAVDAFYQMSSDTPHIANGACAECLVYNRVSEGGCVCSLECMADSHRISDILTGPYPAFNPDHVYTFEIDLGDAPAERLNIGIMDCGCFDNSGMFEISVAPAGTCPP